MSLPDKDAVDTGTVADDVCLVDANIVVVVEDVIGGVVS